jgi:hypothetical protein
MLLNLLRLIIRNSLRKIPVNFLLNFLYIPRRPLLVKFLVYSCQVSCIFLDACTLPASAPNPHEELEEGLDQSDQTIVERIGEIVHYSLDERNELLPAINIPLELRIIRLQEVIIGYPLLDHRADD